MQLPNVAAALRKHRLPCPGKSEPRIRDCMLFRLDEMTKQLSSQTLNVFYLKSLNESFYEFLRNSKVSTYSSIRGGINPQNELRRMQTPALRINIFRN